MTKNKITVLPRYDRIVDAFNIVLSVSLCILVLVGVLMRFNSYSNVEKILADSRHSVSDLPILKFSKKSAKYYQRILGRRQIFAAQPSMGIKKNSISLLGEKGLARNIDFKLLGIISGAQGPQAILVDPKTGKSFYCSGGEIINGFTVKDVMETKVILQNADQNIEIRL